MSYADDFDDRYYRDNCKRHRRCCCGSKDKFSIVATGDQQVPNPVTTEGIARGIARYCRCRNRLSYDIKYKNLRAPLEEPSCGVGSVHFHAGAKTENGDIVKTLDKDNCTDCVRRNGRIRGVWTRCDEQPLTDEIEEMLLNDGLYINFHTKCNPAGEIRGQLLKVPKKHGYH